MRRKKRRKISVIKILFLIIVFMSVVGFGYSLLSSTLKISGNVTGQMAEQNYSLFKDSDANLNLKVYQISRQPQGNTYNYRYSLNLKNVGTTSINGVKITIESNGDIASVLVDGYDYTSKAKTLILTNANVILKSGESIVIDVIVNTKASNLQLAKVRLERLGSTGAGVLDVAFDITNSTDLYVYTYNVVITNNSGDKTTSWQIDIILPEGTTYVSGSSAVFIVDNNVLIIKSDKGNEKINKGAKITINLKLSTDIVNYIPNNINTTVTR